MSEPDAPTWGERIARLAMGLVLAPLCAGTVVSGVRALTTATYEFTWRVREAGVHEHVTVNGFEAQRVGVGLCTFGAMLGLWALALLWTAIGRIPAPRGWTAVSLLLLAAATLAMVPIWTGTPWTRGFYAGAVALAVLLRIGLRLERGRRRIVAFSCVSLFIVIPMATVSYNPALSAGIVAGFFVAMIAGVHLFVMRHAARMQVVRALPSASRVA
jgi:hypothetical protein